MYRILLIIFITSFALNVQAEEQTDFNSKVEKIRYYEEAPSASEFAYNVLGDFGLFYDRIDPATNYKFLLSLAASTLILIKYDQEILDGAQRIARNLNLISDTKNGREGHDIIDLSFAGLDIPIRRPLNTNAAMYFIGDGITHIIIAGSLATYGTTHNDFRATNTASQIMESILVSGTLVQILKRVTGRESPFKRTEDGGKWDFLPSFQTYSDNVSSYDAFPSGHIATAMATTTVLALNYPEHTYIKPVGYTLMGILSWAMLNNGVHWASDYPLGIALGWLSADIAFERGKKRRQLKSSGSANLKSELQLTAVLPYTFSNDGVGMLFSFDF